MSSKPKSDHTGSALELPFESTFGEAISVLNRAAYVYLSRALAPYGLGPGQQAYLITMQVGESLSQEQIARRHRVDKANAARAMQGLEKLGYVTRTRASHDARQWEIRLTARGAQVRGEVQAALEPWIEALSESVTPAEWKVTVEALARIADRAISFAYSFDPPDRS
ncbi:MAG: MarR family winged helix-turn-helix transcriptional regulator [Spirochaetales bacterium]